MDGNLVLFWRESGVALCFGRGNTVLAAKPISLEFKKGLAEETEKFLSENGLAAADVKKVIVVADLTGLLPRRLEESPVFGYFRVTPGPFKFAPAANLLQKSNIKLLHFHLPLPGHPEYEAQMESILFTLADFPVKYVAINSTFSLIDPAGENILIDEGEKLCPGRFTYIPSCHYSTPNFLTRENVLLVNLFLLEPVQSYLDWLSESFKGISIQAPLYFLKGDGTLTSSGNVKTNPLLTWQSGLASYILGGCSYAGQGEVIVAVEEDNEICLALTESHLPMTSGGFHSFFGLEVQGKYPLTARHKKTGNSASWEETLEMLNPFPGPVPLVSFVPCLKASPVFRYPLISVADELCARCAGVLAVPFRLEMEKVSFSSQPRMIHRDKHNLWQAALQYLDREGIQLSQINHRFEEFSLKYLPEDAYLIRLTVWGNLR